MIEEACNNVYTIDEWLDLLLARPSMRLVQYIWTELHLHLGPLRHLDGTPHESVKRYVERYRNNERGWYAVLEPEEVSRGIYARVRYDAIVRMTRGPLRVLTCVWEELPLMYSRYPELTVVISWRLNLGR